LLDGAQAAPHIPVDVREIGCDFYCFSGHKTYGPSGVGVLYGTEEWLERLFGEVLKLCRDAGLVKVGVVALDGTKIQANASLAANRGHESIEGEVKRMLSEAKAKDQEEDALYGADKRGDELPEELRGRKSRLARLKECKERLEREAALKAAAQEEKIQKRAAEEEATGRRKRGRKPKEADPKPAEEAKANVIDPESRVMKTRSGYVQGYNAQAVTTKWAIRCDGEKRELKSKKFTLTLASPVTGARTTAVNKCVAPTGAFDWEVPGDTPYRDFECQLRELTSSNGRLVVVSDWYDPDWIYEGNLVKGQWMTLPLTNARPIEGSFKLAFIAPRANDLYVDADY
ncbi:MAG: aminotransferase class V-fold PLP-dependent enzyme, partial [Elusimicrobiota bacterium]